MSDKLVGAGEAARLLGVTTTTIRNWDKEDLINVVRTPKGHRRIFMSEIERILKNAKQDKITI